VRGDTVLCKDPFHFRGLGGNHALKEAGGGGSWLIYHPILRNPKKNQGMLFYLMV